MMFRMPLFACICILTLLVKSGFSLKIIRKQENKKHMHYLGTTIEAACIQALLCQRAMKLSCSTAARPYKPTEIECVFSARVLSLEGLKVIQQYEDLLLFSKHLRRSTVVYEVSIQPPIFGGGDDII